MIEETDVLERFHAAFDAQPTPGAAHRLRVALLEQVDMARPAPTAKSGVRISLRFVAGLALIAVAIATSGVFVALHRAAIQPAPAQPLFSHALARTTWGMVSSSVGWQETSWFDPDGIHHILRTTDGGAHWSDVTPPSLPRSTPAPFSGGGMYILDGTHAWIDESAWMLRTSDGGRTWRQASWPASGDFGNLYFLDPRHGWLVNPYGLYRTDDGGDTWSQAAANTAVGDLWCSWGEVAFASLNDGWITSSCRAAFGSAVHLLVTHDGGATWSQQFLPTGEASGVPVIFDSANAMVFDTRPAPWMTSDGGKTWSARELPGLKHLAVTFLDPKNGWVVDGSGALYRTNDGGLTWSLVRTSLTTDWSIDQLGDFYFVDSQHGFATFGAATTQYLNKTTDGGKTWSQVGSMPPRGY